MWCFAEQITHATPNIPNPIGIATPDQLGDGSALATPYSVVAIPDTSWIAGTAAGSDEVFIVDVASKPAESPFGWRHATRHHEPHTGRQTITVDLQCGGQLISQLGIEEDASLTLCRRLHCRIRDPKRSNKDGICSSPRAPQPLEPFPARAAMLMGTRPTHLGARYPQMRCCGLRSNTASPDHANAGLRDTAPYHWDGIVGTLTAAITLPTSILS